MGGKLETTTLVIKGYENEEKEIILVNDLHDMVWYYFLKQRMPLEEQVYQEEQKLNSRLNRSCLKDMRSGRNHLLVSCK